MTDNPQPEALARELEHFRSKATWPGSNRPRLLYDSLLRSKLFDNLDTILAALRTAQNTGRDAVLEDVPVRAVSEDAIRHLAIRSPLNRAIYAVVHNYTMSNMSCDDDPRCGYPLVDLMSNPAPADIGTGEMEMVTLVDEIEFAIRALKSQPPVLADQTGAPGRAEVGPDHPLYKACQVSPETIEAIKRDQWANAKGAAELRNVVLGSAPPTTPAEGEE